MGSIVITSPVPPSVVLLSQEGVDHLDSLVERAVSLPPIADGDTVAFSVANALYKELHAASQDIEKTRELLKKPALDYGRQVDQVAKDARQPLDLQKEALGARIKQWQQRENAKREEAARLAREEAARKQRELDAQAETERLAKEAAARQAAEDATPPGEEPAPLPPEPVFQAPAVPQVKAAWTPPPIKSAVREKIDHVVVIVDKALVPLEIAGAELRPIDMALAKSLMKRGVVIPGLRLDEVTGTAATGRG